MLRHRSTAIHMATRLPHHQLNGHNILKLAEQHPEWRKAVKELAQKRNMQPRGPITRRLLELAENPPKKFKTQKPYFNDRSLRP